MQLLRIKVDDDVSVKQLLLQSFSKDNLWFLSSQVSLAVSPQVLPSKASSEGRQ